MYTAVELVGENKLILPLLNILCNVSISISSISIDGSSGNIAFIDGTITWVGNTRGPIFSFVTPPEKPPLATRK